MRNSESAELPYSNTINMKPKMSFFFLHIFCRARNAHLTVHSGKGFKMFLQRIRLTKPRANPVSSSFLKKSALHHFLFSSFLAGKWERRNKIKLPLFFCFFGLERKGPLVTCQNPFLSLNNMQREENQMVPFFSWALQCTQDGAVKLGLGYAAKKKRREIDFAWEMKRRTFWQIVRDEK